MTHLGPPPTQSWNLSTGDLPMPLALTSINETNLGFLGFKTSINETHSGFLGFKIP